MKTGVQLYSLRFDVEKLGIYNVLKEVAKTGCEGVELADVCSEPIENIAKECERLGLEVISYHVSYDDLTDKVEDTVKLVKKLGLSSVVFAYLQGCVEEHGFEHVLRETKKSCLKFKDSGIKLLFHNHAFEFENGLDMVKIFKDEIPDMDFELDIFWLKVAGLDPAKYVQDMIERVKYIHFKELGKDTWGVNPVVGTGNSSCAEVLKIARAHGIEWGIIEIENSETDIFENIKKSCEFLKA